MIITIRTRYSGATDTRGSRIIATGAGRQKSVSYNYGARDAHLVAAEALAALLNLRTVEATGEMTSTGRGYVFKAHNGPATLADGLKVCVCCAGAAANADVSGCQDYWHHTPHALTSQTAAMGYMVIGDSFDWDRFRCDGCDQDIEGQGFAAVILGR